MHEQFVGTRAVDPKHQFDVPRLETYLKEHIDGFTGPISLEQFSGGQSNPTFLLKASSGQYVLRRKPPGKLLPSAHAVDREYRVMTALYSTDVPVAKTYCLCEDESIIGTAFYVMDFVQGRVIWDGVLPEMNSHERSSIYDELNRVIAALHTVDHSAIGLESFGRPGNFVERQISRWIKQYRASETEHIEAMENLIQWLPENVPQSEEVSITHGDYRLDNVIFHPTEARILSVLDWELSTLGHPVADLAYHCMYWRLTPGEFRGIAGVDHETTGIPAEEQYVERYCERTGRTTIENWDFYMAYNIFRLAGIAQGIVGRVRDGTASSSEAKDFEAFVPILGRIGWGLVSGIK